MCAGADEKELLPQEKAGIAPLGHGALHEREAKLDLKHEDGHEEHPAVVEVGKVGLAVVELLGRVQYLGSVCHRDSYLRRVMRYNIGRAVC